MSMYLLLTGTHALHVIVGLLVFGYFWFRRLDIRVAPAFYVAVMYWQFVDVVWLAMFWRIYL